MAPSTFRASVAIGLVVAPLALLGIACSRPPEQQFLTQFFRASRARDNNTISMMSAVEFDPREKGEVSSFEIAKVSEERRSPLDLTPLMEAERKAQEDQKDFLRRKIEYQNANMAGLQAIVKMEKDPSAKFTPDQQKMKAEWDKWREDTATFQKAITTARNAVSAATGPAEASLTQPGQPAFAADKFKGELVSKDVTVNAQVKAPDGQTSQKTLVVTIQRVVGVQENAKREGRPIIVRIAEA
jgi:hypothetical protein